MAEFGLCLMHHGDALPPHAVAREAEARGLDVFYVPENSHVPLARPGTLRQFDGIERLARFHDPFTTLAACAAVTARIRIGTSVCLLTQRDPIDTAHAAVSLDNLSAGRLILGIAGGFIRESMEDYGSGFSERWRIVRERALAMRSLWRDVRPEFHGTYVDFGPLDVIDRPCQPGGPPLWIGSNSKWVPARVAEYADGWMTVRGLYRGDPLADLKQACASRGRDFSELGVCLLDAPLNTDAATVCAEQGYQQLVYFVDQCDAAALCRSLDHIAAVAATVRARVGESGAPAQAPR